MDKRIAVLCSVVLVAACSGAGGATPTPSASQATPTATPSAVQASPTDRPFKAAP
jgi:hypothetical protein